MVIADGNTGERITITDEQTITELYKTLSEQTFTRDENQEPRGGWSYLINLYPKDDRGYVRYTLDSGFDKYDGYSHSVASGYYQADNKDEVRQILEDAYLGHDNDK